MTAKEIEELAGHRQVPAWVVKLVADAVAATKKEWVGLTDEERQRCIDDVEWNKVDWCPDHEQYAKAIEAKLKEKNT